MIRAISPASLRAIDALQELVGPKYQGFAEEKDGTIRVDVDGTLGFRGSTLPQALRRAREAVLRGFQPATAANQEQLGEDADG